MYVLLVDDDPRLTRLLAHVLRQAGHSAEVAADGNAARTLIDHRHHDVLVLDWMLPGLSGLELCRHARHAGYQGGVLMLTARDTLEDRLAGFAAGADDYLVKPFEHLEWLARVEALGRRAARPLQPATVAAGDWLLECGERRIRHRSGGHTDLSPREFQILELLIRRAGQCVPRELIFARVWGDGEAVTDNALDATLRLLRRKLAQLAPSDAIETVRGLGYRFVLHEGEHAR
jgi:DNA-binding response OmpR family regulator